MIELDGIEYSVKTPSENTQDMLTTINNYAADNNITNSKGEQIYIEENFASPLYLILWALGYLVTVFQNLVYGLGKAFSVQGASEKQLLNIADMAGVKRGKPSLTTFDAIVIAMSSDNSAYDADVGTCTITTESTITYNGIVYKPAVYPSLVLEAGQTGYLTFIAQTAGSYDIAEDAIQGFDDTIINLGVFKQYQSVQGQEQESIASLRERIQRRQYSGTSIDACMDAIRALEGVTTCNIYYNRSVKSDIPIGEDDIIVGAREALCLVQGYNEHIAETFYQYLTCPSVSELAVQTANPARILEVQYYTTHANQQVPLVLVKPKQEPIYIKVFIDQAVSSDVEYAMKTAVCSMARSLTVGQPITSSSILALLEDYLQYGIQGVMISRDGESYSYKTLTTHADVLWTFNTDNVIIDMQVEQED